MPPLRDFPPGWPCALQSEIWIVLATIMARLPSSQVVQASLPESGYSISRIVSMMDKESFDQIYDEDRSLHSDFGGFGVAFCREYRLFNCLRWLIETDLARSDDEKKATKSFLRFEGTRRIILKYVCIVWKSVLYITMNPIPSRLNESIRDPPACCSHQSDSTLILWPYTCKDLCMTVLRSSIGSRNNGFGHKAPPWRTKSWAMYLKLRTVPNSSKLGI